jgi:hypothetical protein
MAQENSQSARKTVGSTTSLSERPEFRLDAFVGEWRGQGLVFQPGRDAGQMATAKDSFEWMEGQFFLVHQWTWKFGTELFQGLEMLGWDIEKNQFFSAVYDNAGHHVNYELSEKSGLWKYHGRLQRALIQLAPGGQKMTSQWEATKDGDSWYPICDIHWNKIP